MPTKIEWAEQTWNPVIGCSRISSGCKFCYAERDAWRMANNSMTPQYHDVAVIRGGKPGWSGVLKLVDEKLSEPLRRRVSTVYFVNSMSDLFHESLTDDQIERVWSVMRQSPHHRFIVLTKRARRMMTWVTRHQPAPLPHVWLGVSTEDQDAANLRMPDLVLTPAAIRVVSAEPLLEHIDLGTWIGQIDWLIIGGESRSTRPCRIEWIEGLVGQAQAAGVATFVKQLGSNAIARGETLKLKGKGNDTAQWPPHLRLRDYPDAQPRTAWTRLLDDSLDQ